MFQDHGPHQIELTREGPQLSNRFGVDILTKDRRPQDYNNPKRIWAARPLEPSYGLFTAFLAIFSILSKKSNNGVLT